MYEQDSGVSSGNPFLRGGNQTYQPDPVSREGYGGYRSGNPFNDVGIVLN